MVLSAALLFTGAPAAFATDLSDPATDAAAQLRLVPDTGTGSEQQNSDEAPKVDPSPELSEAPDTDLSTTEPPTAEPPTSEPPTTEPPTTEPPTTEPTTEEPGEGSETPSTPPTADPEDPNVTPEEAEAPDETKKTSKRAAKAAADDVALAAVPDLNGGPGQGTNPGTSEWLIRIQATGDRTGPNGRANLADVTLSAYQATSLTNVTNPTPTATCTTDTNGQCWMKVPTRGANSNADGYLVKADAVPAGWQILTTMNTSSNGLSVGAREPYSFYTGPATSGGSTASRIYTPPVGTNLRASSGTWSSVRNNPTIPEVCGLDVALLVDLSTSVGNAGAIGQVRDASAAVVDALTGTPSRIALHTFGTRAPAPGANNSNLGLTSVATAGQAAPVKSKALGLSISGTTQYTNWDSGLWSLNNMAPDLDAVVMITDGMPTVYGPNGDGAQATRFFEMENAIASANALKSQGVAIAAVGVGAGVQGDSFNLQAISGPVANQDYYQVTNWNNLEAQLRALASKNCEGTVNVVKQVIPVGGTTATAQPRNSWEFDATAPGATVRVDEPGTTYATSATGITGATGVLGFRSNFEGSSQADRRMSVTETPGTEFTLAPQGGQNAVCTRTDTGAAVPVTNITSPTNPGFSVDPIQNATVSCVVYNQALDRSAQLRVDKVWRIDTNGDGQYEETTNPNVAPTVIPSLSASLQLSGNSRLPGGTINFGQLVSNLAVDSTVVIAEQVSGLPPLCTNELSFTPTLNNGTITLTKSTDQGVNEVTLTNTVTCETKLTLEKSVVDGVTPADEWDLDAIAPSGALAGPSGTSGSTGATAPVTPGVVYPLAEDPTSPAAEGYVQQWNPSLQSQWEANHDQGATGSWVCVVATRLEDGEPVWASNQTDGRNGGVTVQAGVWTKCTAVNSPKPTLQLVKQVDRGGDVTTVPVGDARWTLSAEWTAPSVGGDTPITPYPGTQATVEGPGGVAETSVLPGSYTLDESAAQTGYENGVQYSCVVNDDDPLIIDVGAADALTLGAGDAAVCTIVNTAIQPPLTIEKSDGDVAQLVDGTWQIDYTISVSNASAIPSTFTLTDTPDPGTGFSVMSTSWRDASDPSVEIPAPAADTAIAGTTTQSYIFRVIASFDPEAEDPELTCDPADGGAFFNSATVTFPGGDASDTGCGEPAAPEVTKTAQQPTQNANGTWTLSYVVVATNATGTQLAYTLSDDAQALPAGVTGGVWEASGPTVTGGTDADEGTLDAAWAGAGTLATGLISPDATHSYTVTRTVQIGAGTPGDALVCDNEPTDGFWNTATVTNGIGGNESTDCAGVDRPGVDVDKTVTSVSQGDNGAWEITYDVKVTNQSADLAAKYNLDDELHFGGDIVVSDAAWNGPGGTSGAFAPVGTATIATDRDLAAGGTETYTVTVNATIAAAVWQSEDAELTCEDDGSAGGFLNTATVTAAGEEQSSSDCAEPAIPSIEKSPIGAVQDSTDPDLWRVSYLLTVTPSGFDTFYTLTDTPDFAPGVVLGAGSAQRTDTDPDGPATPITAGANFTAMPVALAAGDAAHTWVVTWEARIDGEVDPDQQTCNGPGSAFFNAAELTQGGEAIDEGEACLPVEDRIYPSVSKTVSSNEQQADGTWKIVYDIVVTLPSTGDLNPDGLSTTYDLDDELQYGAGINVSEASWTGPGSTSGSFDDSDWTAQLARDRAIDEGDTHTYVVTVLADVTTKAVTDGTISCTPGEGEAGGFLNTAELVSGPVTTPVEACAEPVVPTIEKTGGDTTDNRDGTFGLQYEIAVRYPDTELPNPPGVSFDLQDKPLLPEGITLVGDWAAAAGNADTPDPDTASWNGSGDWTIISGAQFTPEDVEAGRTEYRYVVTATVRVGAVTADPEPCEDTGGTGILIPNVGKLVSGGYEAEDDGCQVVNVGDVSIEKTAELADGETSVEPGDVFDYVLTVKNNGTGVAKNVQVTDTDLSDRLKITGLSVDPNGGWGPAPGYTGNKVELTINEIPVGGSATVRVTVEFLPAQDLQTDPILEGAPKPEAPTAIDSLSNTACVAMKGDANPDNNCDDVEVPTRDLTATVYTLCVADAPILGWSVNKSESLKDLPINFRWTPDNGTPTTKPAAVTLKNAGGTTQWADQATWPGSAFTPSGISIDYPGWRALQAADIAPDGGYYLPGTTTVMTPAQQAEYVFNGLILDPSELDYAWRGDTTIEFSVNPELTFNAGYPPATAGCGVARHSAVEIEKEASVPRTQPGKSFDYTLNVQNVSDDAAAEGVVVTDQIPADIRVTDVSWPGKGEAGVFPNWQECQVTGQSSGGYGGTLKCELFGPLQPKGSTGGASAAPEITLSVTVNPSSASTDITNTAVVDYHTFGDPDDSGRDSDSATVLLWALAVTGAQLGGVAGGLGALLLIGGAAVLWSRRKLAESPTG